MSDKNIYTIIPCHPFLKKHNQSFWVLGNRIREKVGPPTNESRQKIDKKDLKN